ncbi:hypothetical protein QFC22_002050 [Naganishia vaughanmartiniae]|uniref:Uncharacterized protein n=1 Tax=Naganishia vaughanmartiniae TaxID=1424756 RepID=A0ACC2XHV7_9TREE|nr:hypothetical protein QFC22_002050 [Naganishia vaughanmartiniae]
MPISPNSDRVGEYDMKLMDIDQEHLGIPDTQYDATITFSSTEFARICRDLSALGESVKIEVDKQGIRFSSDGEIGNGSVLLKHSAGRGGAPAENKPKVKKEGKRDPDDEDGSDDEEDVKPDVDEDDVKPEVDEEEEEYELQDEPEIVEDKPKKRGRAPAKKETNGKGAKKVCLSAPGLQQCEADVPPRCLIGKGQRRRWRSRSQHHTTTISLAHILPQVPVELCQICAALEICYSEYEQRSAITCRFRVSPGPHQLLLGSQGEFGLHFASIRDCLLTYPQTDW